MRPIWWVMEKGVSPAWLTEMIGNRKLAEIREERILYMADNEKFKTDRQKVKELTEKLEEGIKQMDALRSSMETIWRTAGELIEGIEYAMHGLQKERESEKRIGKDDLVFKVSILGEEGEKYYLVDNVGRVDFLRLLHDYADMEKDGGLHPEPYLLEHGVHLYLWKDSENAEKNSFMPGFYDVLYMDSEHIVDAMELSTIQLAAMWMEREEYKKPLFNEGQRNLITNYAYKFDNRLDTRAFIKELAAAMEEMGADAVREIMDNAQAKIDALPDAGIGFTEMHLSGCRGGSLLPLKAGRALELHREGLRIYGLDGDGSHALMNGERDILEHGGIFGVEEGDWESYKAMDRQKEDESEKTYQEAEVFGVPALFDNARIQQEDVPEGLHCYDLRGADYDPGEPVTVERHVTVNHAASILTPVPLPIPEQGFLRLGEELNFVGGMMAAREFMEECSGMNLYSVIENLEDAICHENEGLFLNPSAEYGRYVIYQINEDVVKDNYLFMNLELVKSKGIEVRGEDYSLVYGGRLSRDVTLEMLYEKFNISHPEGFRGHSLSVSDVVVTNRGGEVKAYYVDSFGYAELPEFVKQRQDMMEPALEEQMEGLTVKGHFGTWHSIDSVELEGERFFLMESDEYGNTVAHVAVNDEGELVAEDLAHGFDAGFHKAVAEYFQEKGIAYGQKAEMAPENDLHGADSAEYPAVYPHTAGYAAEHGEQELCRVSHNLNIACKKAVEAAVKENFDGMNLNHNAVSPVLEEYGAERMAYVLSATLQHKTWDGRFSKSNKEWAAQAYIPENMVMGRDVNNELEVSCHPAVLDGFVDLFREELRQREKAIGLEPGQNEAGQSGMDEPGQTAAEQEWEDEDELIELGDEREKVLSEMRGILESGGETAGAFAESAENAEQAGGKDDGAVTYFKAKTEELFHSISDMNPSEIEETVKCHVQEKIDESGMDAVIVNVALAGSRCRGLEKNGSDLDVVVELVTDEREDDLFRIFNGDGLHIGEVAVDINPITAQRTGTLETYLPQVEEYLEGVRRARENEPVSLFHIRMNGGERWYKNTSEMDVKGLCKAYAECGNPFVDMGKFGERMEAADYADTEQGERLDFSIEFNSETNKITVFDGEDFICRGMREMLFLQQMEDEPDAAAELAVKLDCLSHDCDATLYHESVEDMGENVSEIARAIRQGDTGHLTVWLANIIDDGAVPKEMERAVELLKELNDYKPLSKIEEMEEQNYNMIDNVPNNGAGEKAQKEENKKPQEKPAGRVSLKERLAQKQAIVSGRGNEPQEGKEKNHREM